MLWLIGQIVVFLLIAAIVGFIIGWLIRTMWPSSRSRSREGELEAALERASSRISDLEAGLRSKRVAANAAAEQEEAALRKVEELEAALANLDSHGDADTGEVDRLQTELEGAMGSITALRTEMNELRADAGDLAALKAERDAALQRLEAAESAERTPTQGGLFLVPDDEAVAAPAAGSYEPTEIPESSSDGWSGDTDLANDADPEPSEAEIEARRLEAVALVTDRFRQELNVAPDDLTRIHGVGPVLQDLLHSMNITTFAQIASFDDEDIDLVSDALGRAFPGRIRRDDWMGSAQAFLDEESEES